MSDGTWSSVGKTPQRNDIPNPVRSELPSFAGEEECSTETSCYDTSYGGVLKYLEIKETTCTSAHYEDGVLVITITFSSSVMSKMGVCFW